MGRPATGLGPAAGGDVDSVTGRLLSVAELREVLQLARLTAAAGRVVPARPSAGAVGPQPGGRGDEPAEGARADRVGAFWLRPGLVGRRGAPRVTSDQVPPAGGARAAAGSRRAPAGFSGAAAVRAWSWLAQPDGPRVMVASAGGGVGVSTVVAVLAGLSAAARPGGAVAMEVSQRGFSPLTRLVCGAAEPVPAGSWLTPPDRVVGPVSLAGLPSGPSGARVVQAGAHWWPRLLDVVGDGVGVLADLGSVEHTDSRGLLLAHAGPAVLVARADTAGVSAALACLTELDADGLARRPLLVLCDSGGSRPGVLRTAARLAATAVDAVVVLPRTAVLRRSPLPIGGWDRRLSAAAVELVCALADRDGPATSGDYPRGAGSLTVLDAQGAGGGVDLVGATSGGRI